MPCEGNMTKCGHGCLTTSEGALCVCPEGSLLHEDGQACTGVDDIEVHQLFIPKLKPTQFFFVFFF